MKKLTIILVLAVFALIGNAQTVFDFGLKAGINTSKISTTMSDYTPETINNYQFGAFARINFGRIYIQPEAYYNSKGGEIGQIGMSTPSSFNLKTIDVPALLGIKIIKKKDFNLRIMGGPVFSILTDKSVKGQLFTESELKNNFFGWQYGAGVDFLFLTLDARMEKYGSDITQAPDFSTKNGHFLVSLGIKLF